MVHPLLTATFDLFLIGSAALVIAGIVAEHFRRESAIGATTRPRRTATTIVRARRVAPVMHRPQTLSRQRPLRRAA